MESQEVWKEVFFEGSNVFVSNKGDVMSKGREFKYRGGSVGKTKELHYKLSKCPDGYLRFCFSMNGTHKNIRIHKLIAETFVPNIENKPFVNHKNGIKTDNRVENLEWCTRLENNRHAHSMGLVPYKLPQYSPEKIIEMYNTGTMSQGKIAKIFNIHQCHVSRIINKKRRSVNI